MDILRLTDPHLTVGTIPEGEKLIDFVVKTAKDNNIKIIEILGDLFHNHAIKRLEVEHFWSKALDEKLKDFEVRILIGNHDKILGKSKFAGINSLDVFKRFRDNLIIIDKPCIINSIGYIPFVEAYTTFADIARDLYNQGAIKTLIAHQTFTGAKYNESFYAKDGVEIDTILQETIISGHIHTKHNVGKCRFLGSPNWQTTDDANQIKGIYIQSHGDDGSFLGEKFFETKDVLSPIYKLVVNEGEDEPLIVEGSRTHLEFRGTAAWIKTMKKKYKGKASLKGKPSDRKLANTAVNEQYTVSDFLTNNFVPIAGITKIDIENYLGGTL